MSAAALPAPLAPADCNLRGFQWMPLDVSTLVDSEFFIHTSGDEFKAALALWCKSWMQVPAGSLPNNDVSLADLSRAKNWKKVKAGALRGWVLCSDDRWYHPIIVAKAMEALPARKAHSEHKAATAERKALEREDRKRLFALLREHDLVPDIHIKTTDLRKLAEPYLSRGGQRDTSRDVTRDKSQGVTAKTGQDMNGQERTGQDQLGSAPVGAGGEPALVPAAGELWPNNTPVPPAPPPPPRDPAKTPKERTAEEQERAELWRDVKLLLVEQETAKTVKEAGEMVGKQAAKYGRDVFVVAVRETVRLKPANAFTYLVNLCEIAAGKRIPLGPRGAITDEQRAAAGEASNAEAERLLGFRLDAANDGSVIDAAP